MVKRFGEPLDTHRDAISPVRYRRMDRASQFQYSSCKELGGGLPERETSQLGSAQWRLPRAQSRSTDGETQ